MDDYGELVSKRTGRNKVSFTLLPKLESFYSQLLLGRHFLP